MRKWFSLILKAIVIFFAVTGTLLSMRAGNRSFMGGTSVLMYFTIQSNIALALISLIGGCFLVSRKEIPGWWYIIKFVGTVSITLTGAVFSFVLAPTMGAHAWTYVNIFTHVVVPIAAIVDFFVTGVDSDIRKNMCRM